MYAKKLFNLAVVFAAMLPAFEDDVCASTPTPILIDINTGNGPVTGSDPGSYARLTATQTVFSATDAIHGRELWITDGTAAGTHLLFDFCPGVCSGDPIPLNRDKAIALGVLYVSADDGARGRELWKVTSAGTVSFVKDINPDALGSNPSVMTFVSNLPGIGFFSASSAASGGELWKTDGTSAGTVLVKDINPGGTGSFICCFGEGLNRVYFDASTPDTGRELFMSDGTASGTVLRADIQPGPGSSSPSNLIEWFNDTMIFSASDGVAGFELWITSATSTTLLKDIATGSSSSTPSFLTGFSGRIFFSADGSSGFGNTELWSTDATTGGTAIFKDICAGSCGSNPRSLTTLNTALGTRLLFFASSTSGATPSVYVSDGTPTGTVPIFGLETVNVTGFTVSGTLAYFTDNTNLRLYRTDGTTGGTILVADFGGDEFVSMRNALGPVGTNRVIIGADDGFVGNEPYIAGPNAGNISLLKNIAPDLGYSDPQELTDVGGTLFFSAFSETTGRELWKVVDPVAGAVLVADIAPGAGNSNPQELNAFDGKLVFSIRPDTGPAQIYVSDGTADGTHPLKDLGPDNTLVYFNCLSVAGDRLYFNGDDSTANGIGPWISDGTAAGTHDINPGGIDNGSFCLGNGFASAGNKVLFQARDKTRGYELFRSDGTEGGTALVRDIVPGPDEADSSSPNDFVSIGTRACFSVGQGGFYGDVDVEPWCSDGTAQGTLPLGDLNPGTDSSLPLSLTGVGNYLLFSAFSPTLGRRIWRSDGSADGTIAFTAFDTGTNLVRDYLAENLQGGTPNPPPLQHIGNVIYFPCTAGEGAVCLQDVRPGHEDLTGTGFISFGTGAAIEALRVFPGGDILMSCWTTAKGRELCRFRSGPLALDAAIVDLAPGAASSSPDQITPAGDYIYFTADDGAHGRELWAIGLRDTIDRIFHNAFE
ncbi:MAG TPA: hypothetical protein VGH81_06195 [Rudaea sp.]|jgi:ELWxxDGT repeat protein